jgi:hypothetical protein
LYALAAMLAQHLATILLVGGILMFIIVIAVSAALSAVRLVNARLLQRALILVQVVSVLSLIVIAERVALKVHNEFLDHSRAQVQVEDLVNHSIGSPTPDDRIP